MTISQFAQIIATIGMTYGGSCISWGRSQNRNDDLSGHSDSFHLSWLAVDLYFDNQAEAILAKKHAERQGLWCKWNGVRTVHIQALHPPE